jgi:hypothetical protein
MATEYGVVLASLMGAAAALTGGVLAQRYQYLLEKRKEHFGVLRAEVLSQWPRAAASRQANLEGRDPYVVVDYVAKDYRSSPGVAFGGAGSTPWSETSVLAEASKAHWPSLWSQWRELNEALQAHGQRTVALLRKLEASFPPLPAGKQWANYGDDAKVAVKVAVVNLWAAHAQVSERSTYPDWVVSQLAQFGFWRGEGDGEARLAFARQVADLLGTHAAEVAAIEQASEALWKRFAGFAKRIEETIHSEDFPGTCRFCPRFLR